MLAPRLAPPAAPGLLPRAPVSSCQEGAALGSSSCLHFHTGWQQVAGTCLALAHPLGSQTGRHLAQERRCGSPGGVAQLDAPSPCAGRALTCGTRAPGPRRRPCGALWNLEQGGHQERHHSSRLAVTVHNAPACPRLAEDLFYASAGPRHAQTAPPSRSKVAVRSTVSRI